MRQRVVRAPPSGVTFGSLRCSVGNFGASGRAGQLEARHPDPAVTWLSQLRDRVRNEGAVARNPRASVQGGPRREGAPRTSILAVTNSTADRLGPNGTGERER